MSFITKVRKRPANKEVVGKVLNRHRDLRSINGEEPQEAGSWAMAQITPQETCLFLVALLPPGPLGLAASSLFPGRILGCPCLLLKIQRSGWGRELGLGQGPLSWERAPFCWARLWRWSEYPRQAGCSRAGSQLASNIVCGDFSFSAIWLLIKEILTQLIVRKHKGFWDKQQIL